MHSNVVVEIFTTVPAQMQQKRRYKTQDRLPIPRVFKGKYIYETDF